MIQDLMRLDSERFNGHVHYESDGLTYSYIVSPRDSTSPLSGRKPGLPTRVYIIRQDGLYALNIQTEEELPVTKDNDEKAFLIVEHVQRHDE